MSRPDFPLTILEFQQRFGTEEVCREYLFCSRWPEGFVCPGCGARDAGGETCRHLWICTGCGRRTSITAGTVMHKTRLAPRTWFWAAYLVSTFHPGISAKQLQRQLGIGCHKTAWRTRVRRGCQAEHLQRLWRQRVLPVGSDRQERARAGGLRLFERARPPRRRKPHCRPWFGRWSSRTVAECLESVGFAVEATVARAACHGEVAASDSYLLARRPGRIAFNWARR